jgi:hypothetical protein
MLTTITCDNCGKKMRLVTEPLDMRVSSTLTVQSDPVSFFKCSCGEEDIPAKEAIRASNTVGTRLIIGALKGELLIEAASLRWLRSIVKMNAKDLSSALGYKSNTVTQWENRHTTFDTATSQGLAVAFARLMVSAGLADSSVFIDAFRASVEKAA